MFYYILSSGSLFTVGMVLLILSVFFSVFGHKKLHLNLFRIVFTFGLVSVIFSSEPIHPIIYLGIIILSASWGFIAEKECKSRKFLYLTGITFSVICFVLLLSRFPYFLMPEIDLVSPKIYVIGDSLSEGLGVPDEKVWPENLSEQSNFRVINLARGGARTEAGLTMSRSIDDADATVFILLGGNNWLQKSTLEHYVAGLDNLLRTVCNGKRQVVMCEIPFPSLQYRLLYHQRRLMNKYKVIAIPRRFLAGLLFLGEGRTVDGIHLTNRGHELMADRLQQILVLQENAL